MKKSFCLVLILCLLSQPLLAQTLDTPQKKSRQEEWELRSERSQTWAFEDLPRHIAGDAKETVWNGWHVLLLAGGIGATLGIHQKDTAIQNNFQAHQPLGGSADVFNIVGNGLVLGGATLTALVISELADAPKAAATSGTMLEAFVLTEVLTMGLKYSFPRTRPDGSNRRSFPSGHTSGVFALATTAEVLYGPWVGIPSYAVASLVGLSRIQDNKHFASDVMAGALLGTMIGLGTAKFHKKEFSKFFLSPVIDENSVGLAVISPF